MSCPECAPVFWCNMRQVRDSHEGFVKVVQLQDTGQQEEARDQNTGEKFGQSKHLQTNCCQPADNKTDNYTFTIWTSFSLLNSCV